MNRISSVFAMVACLIALADAGPGRAQTSPDVVQARLLPGWVMEDGRRMAALRLELAPGWKTYWRAPGDAGIPPSFDWAGSENVKSVRLHWPAPEVFLTNGMQSIGYHDGLVLPVEIRPFDPAAPVDLRLRMDLGVCKDICVPASLTVSGQLSGAGARDAVIGAALGRSPAQARDAGLTEVSCIIDPIKDGLRVTARMAIPQVGRDETVVFEPGLAGVWVAQSITTREGGLLVSTTEMVPPSGTPFALDRSGVTITVLAPGRAVEIHGCPSG